MQTKIIASFLAALMLFAPAALAATALKDYPSFLATADHALDAYVIIGTGGTDPSGLASDVAGAVDIAVRLTELSYIVRTVSGAVGGNVNGIEKDGIGYSNNALTTGSSAGISAYTNTFPAGAVVKNAQFTGLKEGSFQWKSNSYDYREQVDLSGVLLRNDYGTNGVNGTMTMQIASGAVFYQYVFKKAINLSTATTAGTTGSMDSPEYTYPINIIPSCNQIIYCLHSI